jgi:hypothetical protein
MPQIYHLYFLFLNFKSYTGRAPNLRSNQAIKKGVELSHIDHKHNTQYLLSNSS